MVRQASLFSQLIALFNRGQFHSLVFRHKAERFAKDFNSWDHFVAMLFYQLAQAKSLREICGGLSCCVGKLRHFGVKKAPNKSTMSYAIAHRPWQMFQELFYQTLDIFKMAGSSKHRFKLKNKLLSLDLNHIAVSVAIPLAQIPAHQGGGKAALASGSRWLPAKLCQYFQRQKA